MPDGKNPSMLICLKQAHLQRPIADSVLFQCADCRELIWRSKLATKVDPPGDRVCIACAIARAERLKTEGKPAPYAVIDENLGVALAFSENPRLARVRVLDL